MNALENLNVCFLAGTLGQGGAERQLFFMVRALQETGARPRVLCFERNETWENPIKNLGVPVTWVGQSRRRLRRVLRIVRELRNHPADVLQSQHFYTNAYVVAAARLLGLPEIGAMRNDGISEVLDSGRFGGWLNLRAPKLMAVNSKAGIEFALSRGIATERLYSIPNVVDIEHFNPAPSREAGSPLRLLAVGRLSPQKRMDRFLSVLAQVRHTPTRREIQAIIAGDGLLRSSLESQARRLGLFPPMLQFAGAVSNIASLYRAADICVLTSDYEGLPNVLLEAMASGLPVVATAVGGVPQIVREGETGLLTPPRDEPAMVSAIRLLTENPQLRMAMGRRGRAFVEQNHSPARLPSLLAGLYERALHHDIASTVTTSAQAGSPELAPRAPTRTCLPTPAAPRSTQPGTV